MSWLASWWERPRLDEDAAETSAPPATPNDSDEIAKTNPRYDLHPRQLHIDPKIWMPKLMSRTFHVLALTTLLIYRFVQDSPKFEEVQRERSLVANGGAELHDSVALPTMESRLHTSNIIRTHWRPLVGTPRLVLLRCAQAPASWR